jgi:hypothetical protein
MYLDPGFGSMVIQAVIGLIAAGSVAFYTFRQKIAILFGRSPKKDSAGEMENKQEESEFNKDE